MSVRKYSCDSDTCPSPLIEPTLEKLEESFKNYRRKSLKSEKLVKLAKSLRNSSDHFNPHHSVNYRTIRREQYDREILKLSKKYQQDFYTLSNKFETWASRRRILINKLDTHSKSVETTKEWCERGRFTFSSIAILGSAVSMVLDKLNMDLAPSVFIAATTVGSLSLICSLIEIYKKKNSVEDLLHLLQDDSEEFEALERNIQRGAADTDLKKLFPYGVDFRLFRDELAVERNNENFAFEDESEIIFFLVLLSNVKKEPELLHNEEFISKVKSFAYSKIAKTWWNRLKYKGSSYNPEKFKLYKELKSLLVLNPNTFPVLSLAALPMSYSDYLPAVGVFVLHSLVTFDAFCQLSVKNSSKETTLFKRLRRILNEEHNELKKVYNLLTPYNE